jgi:valyl-tRNA synthetase
MAKLTEKYTPNEFESQIYQHWVQSGAFKSEDTSTKPPYSVVLPPPNVTGFLHLGHAVNHCIQDALVRWKRMNGFNAMWLPGTDHAGIATQMVVEKELKKEGTTRKQLGRKAFEEKVWEWKNLYGERIYSQMKVLGDSCDWDRKVFTLDEGMSNAVKKVFVSLYNRKLIYKGTKLVNWSGPLETAISDLEVEHKEVKGSLWHLKYLLSDGSGELVVGTTRPETLLGDVAVAVHPEDTRYSQWIGKKVKLPIIHREVPIISDEFVDQKFGSGVVKITPGHDVNDYKVGKTHKLPIINLLDDQCRLNESAGPYKGLSVLEARKKILLDLKTADLIAKEEVHTHSVGFCSRSGAVVEPRISDQWFMRMEHLAVPAKRVVESGTLELVPESWTKVYLHWLNQIEDWCISRQLWWGHRIPAWNCLDCKHTTVSESTPSSCESCKGTNISQEEDVLDTWFSASLWPFVTLGWPKKTESLETFYPTSILVTGPDILFFWVARMVIMGLEFCKDVPFRKVYLNGIVRDSQGRKMSKSLGNSVDPVDMISKYGCDSFRFAVLAHGYPGKDLKFSEQRVEAYRNFMNKIWNAARFLNSHLEQTALPTKAPLKGELSDYDHWIISKIEQLEKSTEDHFEKLRLAEASLGIYEFVWYEFCDWYLELIKLNMNPKSLWVAFEIFKRCLKLLHPIAPFITEKLFKELGLEENNIVQCATSPYPNALRDSAFLALGNSDTAQDIEFIKQVISQVRNIRGENLISPAVKIKVRLNPDDDRAQKLLGVHKTAISQLCRTEELIIGQQGSMSKCAVAFAQQGQLKAQVIVPLEGLVDIDQEIKRIQKNMEKLQKEIIGVDSRLSNENYVKGAAEDVVQADRLKQSEFREKLDRMREALMRLQS